MWSFMEILSLLTYWSVSDINLCVVQMYVNWSVLMNKVNGVKVYSYDFEVWIKPCPWCGEPPFVGPADPECEGDGHGYVVCQSMDCPVRPRCDDGLFVAKSSDACKRAAIKRWNERI
jgi:hypothetical protein